MSKNQNNPVRGKPNGGYSVEDVLEVLNVSPEELLATLEHLEKD